MNLKRQKNPKSAWGEIKLTYQNTAVYISLINYVLLAGNAYSLWVRDWANLPLWAFLLMLGAVIFVAMIIEYKFSMPAQYRALWDQCYRHSTMLPNEVNEIKAKLDEINEKLDHANKH